MVSSGLGTGSSGGRARAAPGAGHGRREAGGKKSKISPQNYYCYNNNSNNSNNNNNNSRPLGRPIFTIIINTTNQFKP